ncbi:hypothetical protein LEP1GSC124_1182, partial [Leptospira interrogans serovar Pyrogenes str. 200701872]
GHKIIDFLYGLKFRESVRDDGPKSHEIKKEHLRWEDF